MLMKCVTTGAKTCYIVRLAWYSANTVSIIIIMPFSLRLMMITCFFPIEKCALCYDLTHSTPGYAADPNNCAKYYVCEMIGNQWEATNMNCPNCTFWDQNLLTCVSVDDTCLKSVSVFTDEGVTAQGAYSGKRNTMLVIFSKCLNITTQRLKK